MDDISSLLEDESIEFITNASKKEIERLPHFLSIVAKETGSLFFDAATVAKSGRDQLHMTEDSHKNLASSLFEIIKNA